MTNLPADLVFRLRDADMGDDHGTQKLVMDAADEIERLAADAANERAEAQSWKAVAHDHSERLKVLTAELAHLRADAVKTVLFWSDYVSEYFRDKHDLAGDIARLKGTK